MFYAAISAFIGGAISLFIEWLADKCLKRQIRFDSVFLELTILILIVFILLIVIDEPFTGGR
jgi:hypothetical protein